MGGRGGSSIAAAPPRAPVPPAPPPPPAPAAPTTPSGKTLADVQKMDDKGMHDFLIDVDKTDAPDFLSDLHLQRMVYGLGLNEKPDIVSQKEFDDLVNNGAPVLYRTVNDTTLPGNVKFSATQQQQMLLHGDLTWVGRGVHGDGLYFSDSKSGSLGYGRVGKSAYIEVALNGRAKPISEAQLQREYDAFIKNHPQTRRALGFAKSKSYHDSLSQFALLRGYNIITSRQWSGETYYTILDRSVLSSTGKITKH